MIIYYYSFITTVIKPKAVSFKYQENWQNSKKTVKKSVFRRSENYYLGWYNSIKIRTIRDKAKKELTAKGTTWGV